MHYRYLVSKGFDNGVVTKTSMRNGRPIYSAILSRYSKLDEEEYSITPMQGVPDSIALSESIKTAKTFFESDDVLKLLTFSIDGSSTIPLSQQFDFVFGKSFNSYDLNKVAKESCYEGCTLWDIINDDEYIERLNECAVNMFPYKSPITGGKDVKSDTYYSHLIPIVCMSGCVLPQTDEDGHQYFNPEGSISVAEFLDSLNAIKYGSNSELNRKKSLDCVSTEDDYFNMGYNSCLSGFSSPFYRLYSRAELIKPITRLELAYITVLCWSDFVNKFEHVHSGRYDLGINIDWEHPSYYLNKFSDGFDYKIVKKVTPDEYKVISLNLRDYIDTSISDLKEQIKSGQRGIPLPMFMSLLELDALDLFYFEGKRLEPMKEVSRGELTYFITKLAKEFTMKFVSKGDNSYE